MLLYDNAYSGNCWKVRLLLHRRGIVHERRELDVVDRSGRDLLLGDLNPALRVPTLVCDDGRALGESGAILWYLADGTEWVPTDLFARAQVLQWMFFEQYSFEPNIAVLRFRAHYGIDAPQDDNAGRRVAGGIALAAMERHLAGRDWFVADRDTIADVALYGYCHVADEAGYALSDYPAISAWLARFAALPGHVGLED